MINHPVREEVMKLGSLVVYYFWYIDPKRLSLPAVQKFYWHDKSCVESIGPFTSVTEAMIDYTRQKKQEKALQQANNMQKLQIGIQTGRWMTGPQKQEYPRGSVSWKPGMAIWDPEEKKMKLIPVGGKNVRSKR